MSRKSNAPTSKDVAALAGVSQATVSRFLSGKGYISEAAKERVLAATQELNYRPNAFARTLNNQKSNLIGIILPSSNYPLYLDLLNDITTACQERGYSTIIIPGELQSGSEFSINNLFQYKVDGIITASAHHKTNLYYECQRLNLPVVQILRVDQGSDCSFAASDNYGSGVEAAKQLIKRNGQSFMYLSGHLPSKTNEERYQGFALQVKKLTGKVPHHQEVHFDYHRCKALLKKLFESNSVPDSIFCATDIIGYAAMDVLRYDLGLSIPQDVQIIGYDNLEQSSWSVYQLSSFEQNIARLSEEAVNILVTNIENPSPRVVNLNLSTDFHPRESLRPLQD